MLFPTIWHFDIDKLKKKNEHVQPPSKLDYSMLCCTLLYVHFSFAIYLDGEERAGCFAWFVLPVSRDGCVALPRCAIGLFAGRDCGIS